MERSHREAIGIFFSLAIIVATAVIVREFLVSLAWASIIAVATWPLYQRVLHLCREQGMVAATVFTALVTLVFALPTLWLMSIVGNEIQAFSKFLYRANAQGIAYPHWLDEIKILHTYVEPWWMKTLGRPHGIETMLTSTTTLSLKPMTGILHQFGRQIAKRGMMLGFTIMSLFFLYKDGANLVKQVNAMGKYFLAGRWALYSNTLPGAIKATVNGLIIVGIGVGIIMGGVYAVAGLPAPVLLGGVTAVLAMIPFGVVLAFATAMGILLVKGEFLWAILVVGIGTLVMFIADHFVRPSIIGGATQLPFLAVLFGILGGVKTFGLVGLFIGPMAMVFFITLWHEADLFER